MGIFDIDGPLSRNLTKIADLVILNILTLLISLTIAGAGAAVCAMHAVLIRMARDGEGKIINNYFSALKENAFNATCIFLIHAAVNIVLILDFIIFSSFGGGIGTAFAILSGFALFAINAGFTYALPMQARYYNGIKITIKNSFLLAAGAFPKTLLIMAVNAVFFLAVFFFISVLFPAAVFLGLSLPGYLSCLIYLPLFERIEKKKQKSKL